MNVTTKSESTPPLKANQSAPHPHRVKSKTPRPRVYSSSIETGRGIPADSHPKSLRIMPDFPIRSIGVLS